MAYSHVNTKGVTYYLNSKVVRIGHGTTERTIYYFSKDERDTACDLPEGMEVFESRHGLPLVRKIK